MATHGKEDGKGKENKLYENVLSLSREHLPSNNAGSPKICFQPKIFFEAFEVNSSFSPALFTPTGNSLNLRKAIRDKKVANVRKYSEAGHDLNFADASGFTPLHHAVIGNSTEVVSMLLNCQANVNCPGQQLLTPLHVAVR